MDALDRLVGERLSASRRRRGLSQADFGSMIGRSESWVSKVETGAMRLDSLVLARQIAGLLGVDVRFLLGLDSESGKAAAMPGAREFDIRHLLVSPSDWEAMDPVHRRWFFVQAGAGTLEVLQALRAGRGDLPDRGAAARLSPGRVDAETVDGLGEVVLQLRTAYRSVSGYSLLGPAYGMLNLVTELAQDAGRERARMVALIGQTGTLDGVGVRSGSGGLRGGQAVPAAGDARGAGVVRRGADGVHPGRASLPRGARWRPPVGGGLRRRCPGRGADRYSPADACMAAGGGVGDAREHRIGRTVREAAGPGGGANGAA